MERPDCPPIDFENITHDQINLRTIARNIACFTHSAMGVVTLAQVSVMAAGEVRSRGFDPGVQMQALLHFAGAAYVPHPLVPVTTGQLAIEIFRTGGEAMARVTAAICQKYRIPERVPDIVYMAVEAELASEAVPYVWSMELASWNFLMAAIRISLDVSTECASAVMGDIPENVQQSAWLCMGSCPSPACSVCPNDRRRGNLRAMSLDLQAVFTAHGFDPNKPQFEQLRSLLEHLEMTASADETLSEVEEIGKGGLN